jgi:hypothetical protein
MIIMRQRQHPYGGKARLSLVTPLMTVHAHTHMSHHILCVRGPQAAAFVLLCFPVLFKPVVLRSATSPPTYGGSTTSRMPVVRTYPTS